MTTTFARPPNFDEIESASEPVILKAKFEPIIQEFEFRSDGTTINAREPNVGDGLRVQSHKKVSTRQRLYEVVYEALAAAIADPIVEDLVFIGRKRDCA